MVDEHPPESAEAPSTEPAAAHAIAREEPVPQAVRRIVLSVLDGAIDDLQPPSNEAVDTGVHEARKKVKRVRAVLRLVRGGIGTTTYRIEDISLRDTSRITSDLRDAAVLIETLDAVRGRHADEIGPDALGHTHTRLVDRYDRVRASTSPGVRTDSVRSLGEIRSRFAAYPVEELIPDDFDSVMPGLRRTYRRGRRDHRSSVDDPTVHNLHEWRKAVKYLRYQMEALEPVEPARIGSIARELDELGELLGDDHDLAVLADTLRSDPASCPSGGACDMLVSLIESDRSRLHTEALRIGRTRYAESSKAFVARIGAYWEAARG